MKDDSEIAVVLNLRDEEGRQKEKARLRDIGEV